MYIVAVGDAKRALTCGSSHALPLSRRHVPVYTHEPSTGRKAALLRTELLRRGAVELSGADWSCARSQAPALPKLWILRTILQLRAEEAGAQRRAWVFWLDSDAAFLLDSPAVQCVRSKGRPQWWSRTRLHHVVASGDVPPEPFLINTGAVLYRANYWTTDFLGEMLKLRSGNTAIPLLAPGSRDSGRPRLGDVQITWEDCVNGTRTHNRVDSHLQRKFGRNAWVCDMALPWRQLGALAPQLPAKFDCCWPEQTRASALGRL